MAANESEWNRSSMHVYVRAVCRAVSSRLQINHGNLTYRDLYNTYPQVLLPMLFCKRHRCRRARFSYFAAHRGRGCIALSRVAEEQRNTVICFSAASAMRRLHSIILRVGSVQYGAPTITPNPPLVKPSHHHLHVILYLISPLDPRPLLGRTVP